MQDAMQCNATCRRPPPKRKKEAPEVYKEKEKRGEKREEGEDVHAETKGPHPDFLVGA